MRWLDRLLAFLGGAALALLGGTGVLQWLRLVPEDAHPIFEAIHYWLSLPGPTKNSVFLLLGNLLLVGLGVAVWFIAFRRRPRRRSIHVRTADGEFEISVRALRELINAMRKRVKGVRGIKPRVDSKDQGLSIEVELRVEGDRDVPGIVREFKRKLRKQLSDVFGIEELRDLSVYIENVSDEVIESVGFDEDEPDDEDRPKLTGSDR